jgi:hypothetical protein
MAKWSKDELLCNARGLDDGYLYMYQNHPFGKKLYKLALEGNKTAIAPKEKLTDSASYGFAGFTGSVRPPLSNEIHKVSEDGSELVKVQLPASASKIDRISHDNLFSEPIESNEAICVAFTEPRKYSHKSILLAGANPLPSKLTGDDLRIRRPKLNRFGGTIANLGMGRGNGNSYQSGYGSMNISSYERDLAQRTGRGHELYQPGVRAWGAMEPAPKRHRAAPNQQQQQQQQQHGAGGYGAHNPFSGQNRGGPPNIQQQSQRPPWQNRGPPQQQQQMLQWQPPPPPPPSHHHHQHHQQQQQQRPHWQPPPSSHQQQQQSSHYQQRGGHSNPQRHSHQQQRQSYNQQPQRQQGYNFQALANQHQRPQNSSRQQQQSRPQPARADGNVMSSLRAQLVSTLKQNKKPGQGQNDRRG